MCPDPNENANPSIGEPVEETTPETRHPQPRIVTPDRTITGTLKKTGADHTAQTIAQALNSMFESSGENFPDAPDIIIGTDTTVDDGGEK